MRLRLIGTALVVAALAAAGVAVLGRETWQAWLGWPLAAEQAGADEHAHEDLDRLRLSPQARGNLGLVVKPIQPQTYWRTIQVPGQVVEPPGLSDRVVTSPVTGVVQRIDAVPGDTVRPGAPLFTLRLVGEGPLGAQADLYKTLQEIQITREQRERLRASAAVPEARIIELENQERRLRAAERAYRQELLTRGLEAEQIEGVAAGKFVKEVVVVVPGRPEEGVGPASNVPAGTPSPNPPAPSPETFAYEVEELKVHLGQQVQVGQTLALLANHRDLLIEGRAFRQEATLLEKVAQEGWPIQVEFAEEAAGQWPPLTKEFRIRHLANTVDPVSKTFPFYLPLANDSRSYQRDGRTYLVWRFRPGQRVRLYVPVEPFRDVFVLPREAVVREGPEAYVFRQNGDLFERKAVRVLYEDRRHAVLADGGGVGTGQYLAHNGAASLNRVLKAQAAGGEGGHGGHDHAGHRHDH